MNADDKPVRLPDSAQPIVIHGKIHGVGSTGEYGSGPPLDRRVSGVPDRRVAQQSSAVVADSPVASASGRLAGLDAVRGLFLIAMTFGFTLGEGLPKWMYHVQTPPSGGLVDVPGIAWIDWAYAAFLFTMAAAIPVALSRRVASGALEVEIFWTAIRRWFMLFVFALMVGHADMFLIGYTTTTRIVSIVGFILLFGMYVRRREDWNARGFTIFKRLAWVLGALFLFLSPPLHGKQFSLGSVDGVMVDLAFASLVGTILWYLVRGKSMPMLAVLVASVAMHLSSKQSGWISDFWWQTPAHRFSLMAVVIPGLIAGQALVNWWAAPAAQAGVRAGWAPRTFRWLVVLCFASLPIVTIGLYNRWVEATAYTVFALVAVGLTLTRGAVTPHEKLLRSLFMWGSVWLVLGTLLEPFEGGIKKVPETFTYFFTTAGLTSLILAGMITAVDLWKNESRARILTAVGVNPLLCYVLFSMFLNPISDLTESGANFMRSTPALGLFRSILITVLTIWMVTVFTRKRVFWGT